MTDLEMTKLCAEAMGYEVLQKYPPHPSITACPLEGYINGIWSRYEPFVNDAQAMALVKKFHLQINWKGCWPAVGSWEPVHGSDLNRAIVECAAKSPEAGGHMSSPPLACLDCGKVYRDFPLDATLPDEQWRMIHDSEGGILCANCMVARAAKLPGAVAVRMQIEFA